MTQTTEIEGRLTSIQFDKNGLPIYVFTDKGIYHVEFREMEKDDEN